MDYNKALANIALKGLPKGMKLWYGNESGEPVDQAKKLHVDLLFAAPDSFIRACYIQTNEGQKALLDPTPAQMRVAQAYQDNRWLYVSKYRQAMISTIVCLLMLRDTMYGEAIKTAIVAQDRDTCDEIMDRIIYALDNLPEVLKNPLKKGTKATRERIEFANGNQITSITVGSKSPGVGKSRDRVHITEGCEMDDDTFGRLQEKLFPAVESRPNARVVLETTPGDWGSRLNRLWLSIWNPPPGQPTRWKPLFLEWWLDKRRRLLDEETGDPVELGPLTEEELGLVANLKGATRHHMYFRRAALPATFDNRPERFDNKYPPGPTDGWLTQSNKIYAGKAAEYLRLLKDGALKGDEQKGKSGLWEFVPPNPRRFYMFCVDPANFGSQGDYSAVSVFDVSSWEEVASVEGRFQPTELHAILAQATQVYRQAGKSRGNTVVIESNAAALLGIAINEDLYNVWHQTHKSGRTEPGWRATSKSIQEAEGDMEVALNSHDIKINSLTGIQQLINFDGKNRDRRISKGKNTSHFDLARTYIIAAWALTRLNWPRHLTDSELRDRLKEQEANLSLLADAELRMRMATLDNNLRKRRRRLNGDSDNPWAPGAGWTS